MQSLRCTHEPPIRRQSSQPSPLGVTSLTWSRCLQTSIADDESTTLWAALAEPLVLLRVSGVPEGDAIANHGRAAQEARTLHGILAEAVADRIDRRLETFVAGADITREQAHLPGVRVGQSREANAKRADLTPRLARSQKLQGGTVDLLSGGDGIRHCHLLGEMSDHRPVDDAHRHHPAPTPSRTQPAAHHVREA